MGSGVTSQGPETCHVAMMLVHVCLSSPELPKPASHLPPPTSRSSINIPGQNVTVWKTASSCTQICSRLGIRSRKSPSPQSQTLLPSCLMYPADARLHSSYFLIGISVEAIHHLACGKTAFTASRLSKHAWHRHTLRWT